MTVDALVAWPPLSSTLNDGSLIHMPIGAGRSYIPILMGTASRADAEVMYSGGEGALLPMLRTEPGTRQKNQRGAVVSRTECHNKPAWQKGRLE
jgi:hypothetical protein